MATKEEKFEVLHLKINKDLYDNLMKKAKKDSRTLHGYVRLKLTELGLTGKITKS